MFVSKLTPWQQCQQEQNNKRRKSNLSSQEKYFLKVAENNGLLHLLAEDDLISCGCTAADKSPSYPGDAYLVQLSHKRLKDISLIDICERLRICNLSNNFLQNVTPLKWCVNLFCLDLHSNQINHVPNCDFWSSLSKLTVVYMHDNGIYNLKELKSLAKAPVLYNLTLYDTPISLTRNYRHCVVNAAWTLKALDHCVVSDEEIIEDAKFPIQFKPMQKQFFFKSVFLTIESTRLYRDVLSCINKEISVINHIQSKWCPVLIIQRCIRGFLVRLRYNYIIDTRLWAAVSIQRFYRGCKGYPHPPPPSPISQYQPDFVFQSLSSLKLDYETYVKMKQSRHKSFMSVRSVKSVKLTKNPPMHVKSFTDGNIRKRISIDLEKLEGKTTQMLRQEASKHISTICIPHKKKIPQIVESAPVQKEYPEDVVKLATESGLLASLGGLRNPSKIGKYNTQYEFLAEVKQIGEQEKNDDGNDFRLSIQKPPIMKHDALEELITRTIESADDIRRSIREIERRIKSAPMPEKRMSNKAMNADQKFFLKTQGSMGLSCFNAVNKAYIDRRKAELLLKRKNHVNYIRDVGRNCKQKVKQHKNQYRIEAVDRKHNERAQILNALAIRRQINSDSFDKIAARRTANHEVQQTARRNYKFALEFNCQNASIGKALANHNRRNRKEEATEKQQKYIKNLKDEMKQKKDEMCEYLCNLKMTKQGETLAMKNEVESLLKEKENARRIELLKSLQSHTEKRERSLMTPTVLAIKQMQPLNTEKN